MRHINRLRRRDSQSIESIPPKGQLFWEVNKEKMEGVGGMHRGGATDIGAPARLEPKPKVRPVLF